MTNGGGRRPRRGSIVRFWHSTANQEPKWRPGVVVWAEGGELDLLPGLSDPPKHEDYFLLVNPSGRAGLDHETHFDLRDVNVVAPDEVEVVGIFPRPQWDELLEQLALLGVVAPGER